MTQAFSLDQVLFREMIADDYNFMIQSWLLSYRSSADAEKVFDDIYFQEQQTVIEHCVDSGDKLLLVSREDPNVILGYIFFDCSDEDNLIIDWIHIKKTFRRMGICNLLMNKVLTLHKELHGSVGNITFTHWPSQASEHIIRNMFYKHKVRYNPYLKKRFL